jgi:NCAIR mutase (PurE)-related protein
VKVAKYPCLAGRPTLPSGRRKGFPEVVYASGKTFPLFDNLGILGQAKAIIVVGGMEGALASLV